MSDGKQTKKMPEIHRDDWDIGWWFNHQPWRMLKRQHELLAWVVAKAALPSRCLYTCVVSIWVVMVATLAVLKLKALADDPNWFKRLLNGSANDLGGDSSTLKFVEGTVGITEDNLLKNKQLSQNEGSSDSESSNTHDVLIALHACNVGADDAMYGMP